MRLVLFSFAKTEVSNQNVQNKNKFWGDLTSAGATEDNPILVIVIRAVPPKWDNQFKSYKL